LSCFYSDSEKSKDISVQSDTNMQTILNKDTATIVTIKNIWQKCILTNMQSIRNNLWDNLMKSCNEILYHEK